MREFYSNSVYCGVVISLLSYWIGSSLQKKFKSPLFNPLLISVLLVIAFLLTFHIDYETYNAGAKYITYLLTPATICLAVPLYDQIEQLKNHWRAILIGTLSGVITCLVTILLLSILFHLGHTGYVTLLPKSITTAIGIDLAAEMGGRPAITIAAILITGCQGNMFAEVNCRLFRITNPVAKGVAIGTASHAMGTAKAMEMGEIEGAMSGLSIVTAGIMTAVLANFFAMMY